MSGYYECPECHALTDKHAEETEHRATCSHSNALPEANERIAELERVVEDLEQRLAAVEGLVNP